MVRVKHRYLLINILYPESSPKSKEQHAPSIVQFHQPSPPNFESLDLKRLVLSTVSTLFGEYGVGVVQGSLSVKYFSPTTSTAIIRVARAHYRIIWAALTSISRLPKPHNDVSCVVSVVRVSGTMRKAEECAIKVAKDLIRRVNGNVEDTSSWYKSAVDVDDAEDSESESDSDEAPLEDVEKEMEASTD